MKYFVKANTAKSFADPIDLASLLSIVPAISVIVVRHRSTNVILFEGLCGKLLDLEDGDILTDAEGYEYEVGQAMLSEVSRVYPNNSELIIGINL